LVELAWSLGSRVVVPSVVGGSFDEAVSVISPLGLNAVVVENRLMRKSLRERSSKAFHQVAARLMQAAPLS